jgi:hypothetical protein
MSPFAEIVGVGELLTEIVIEFDEAVHPLLSVVITEYTPELVTVIDWATLLLLHAKELKLLLFVILMLTESPTQKLVDPDADIAGTTGIFSVI